MGTSHRVACKNMFSPPPSGLMKPYFLIGSNVSTVPRYQVGVLGCIWLLISKSRLPTCPLRALSTLDGCSGCGEGGRGCVCCW